MTTTPSPIATLLEAELTLGEPQAAGSLTLFPVLGAPGRLEYLSFAEAATQGFVVKELEQASVNDLQAVNPLDVPVLLYDGEEVKGAQQDRTLDVPVLVPARSTTRIPVSCVEHGRWDGTRHEESFAPSPAAAYPSLRARKNSHVRAAMAAGREMRADQGAVWDEVAAKAERHDASSDTGAMGDVFAGRGDQLAELERRFSRQDGQLGTLACLAGVPTVLDFVSRADVLAALWTPLLRGYCLDALEHDGEAPVVREAAEAFMKAVAAARPQGMPGAGLGTTLAFQAGRLGGTGLAHEGELVQLSAFTAGSDPGPRRSRIARPSRRR
jgi:hypothetical protein